MSLRPRGVPGEGEKLDGKVLRRLIRFVIMSYKKEYILIGLCIIVASLTSVLSSVFIQTLIDDYISPLVSSENPDFGPLFQILTIIGLIFMTGVIANFISQRLLVVVSQGTMEKVRVQLFTHMETLPLQYFDTHAHGDIMSIYTNDTDTLRQVISQSMPQFVTSLVTILSVVVSMIYISPSLTLVAAVMVFIMQIVMRFIMKRAGHYFSRQQHELGKENGYIEEMMEGVKVVKVFNHEEKAIEAFVEINNALEEASYKANNFGNILMPIVSNLGNVSYVITAFLGGAFAINGIGNLTIGSLAGFLALNRSFTQPLSQISQQINAVIMAMAGAQRIFALMDQQSEVDEGSITLVNVQKEGQRFVECDAKTGLWAWKDEESLIQLKGDVRFEHVHFSYVEGKPILHDISLYAHPGQKIAFVGATGAGKTTITNLINRFYDIHEGMIRYDGIDIKAIKKDALRKSLGIVLQDTHLFTGSIEDNIKYARPHARRQEVIDAAKLANAHTFIEHLEHGYDTLLTGNGAALSQGQRQLLSIARAALANPPVLILDEATSSIDSKTERLVQNGMDQLMHGRTTFVIAHRLSTIKNADVIMVMDQGRIIERGDHASLMAKGQIYYQLYTGLLEID